MTFQGKVAIVTGASRGIGKAIAIALAKEGAQVVAAARTEEASKLPGTIHETVKEIESFGGKAIAVRTDVSDEASVDAMVRQTLEAYGRIDILVNNAAVAFWAKVVDFPANRWDLVMKVNLKGPFLCSKAVLKKMIEQKSGSIVNISSGAGDHGGVIHTGIAYGVSKAGLDRMTTAMAEEIKEHNIAVNAIKPRKGVITEGMIMQKPGADLSAWDKPEDYMVKGVLFLAAQNASGVTGKVFKDEDLCRKYKL